VTYTLAQARSEVRALIDEPVAQFWSDAQLNSWINQACEDIARIGQSLWQFTTTAAVLNQQNYNLPADFLGIHRIEFVISGGPQTYTLEFRGITTMDELWGILHQLPSAFPDAFFLWNNTLTGGMYFASYPVPGTAGTYNIYYYRDAAPAAADGDNIDVTPGYETVCFSYAAMKAFFAARDPMWQQHRDLYASQLLNMVNKTERFSDQGDQFTSGQQNLPLYAYVDNDGWG
jgi:hypothetical protein